MGSPEFKVGDRVRVAEERFDEYGQIGTVTAVSRGPYSSWPYRVMIDDPAFGAGRYAASELTGPVTTSHVVVDDDGPDPAPGLRAMVREVRERHDVDHPAHYTWAPVEVIELTEWLNFNLGNVVKYCARADHKGNPEKDLEKALWYLRREIERRKKRPDSV